MGGSESAKRQPMSPRGSLSPERVVETHRSIDPVHPALGSLDNPPSFGADSRAPARHLAPDPFTFRNQPRNATTAKPEIRIATSTAVPMPRRGGIERRPVRKETTPVAASRSANGSDTTPKAVSTARRSVPPLQGRLHAAHAP